MKSYYDKHNDDNNITIIPTHTIIQFISIQWRLLTCRFNSTCANYKASTRTQIQHKTVQTHKNKTLNRQNKTNIAGSK
jgi:putative component of membrane protein insertase Oxa1/YidC/SpoIIIJ protein YidD